MNSLHFLKCVLEAYSSVRNKNIEAPPVIQVSSVCTRSSRNADVNFWLSLISQSIKQFDRISNLSLKFNAVLKENGTASIN